MTMMERLKAQRAAGGGTAGASPNGIRPVAAVRSGRFATSAPTAAKSAAPAYRVWTPDEMLSVRLREFILLAGPDKVGKTSGVLSFALWVEEHEPDATFWVIDTENRVQTVYQVFARRGYAPKNIRLLSAADSDGVLMAAQAIRKDMKPWDWWAVESMARWWELVQDAAYRETTDGLSKSEYLAQKKAAGGGRLKGSPIPQPDKFWDIAKNLHDGEFLNVLTSLTDINVLMTTTIERVRGEAAGSRNRENADRKDFRVQHGIDAGLSGAPRLPYYPATLLYLHRDRNGVVASVLGDSKVIGSAGREQFPVPDALSLAYGFFDDYRPRAEEGLSAAAEPVAETPAEAPAEVPAEGEGEGEQPETEATAEAEAATT